MRRWVNLETDVKSLGFYVSRGRPRVMSRAHAHTDIEINYLLAGTLGYLHAGQTYQIERGRTAVFWAGVPHRLVEVHDCQMIWVVLPLAWYMQWQLPGDLTQRLLKGEVVFSGASDIETAMDEMLLTRWAEDMANPDADVRRIVILELEARFRRLAREMVRGQVQQPSANDASGMHAHQLAAYMTQHYRENLSVRLIADSAGLHPNYAMQLFKKRCGMGMWEYLTRLRISHAQRLLLTTDWKTQVIAAESGFRSPSRFYEAFTRIVGGTPKECRASGKQS